MSELDKVRKAHDISIPSKVSRQSKFNMAKIAFPDTTLHKTFGHLFFTKPKCNFLDGIGDWNEDTVRNYEFKDLLASDPSLFYMLSSENTEGNFIPILYDKAHNFSTNDVQLKTRDVITTPNGWKSVYGGLMVESITANELSISFDDNRNLDVMKLIKIWVTYIDLIGYGKITPTRYNRLKKILDYAGSLYYVVTAEDARTILYYCKYEGIFPLNIPDSVLSTSDGEFKPITEDITFQYWRKNTKPIVMTQLMQLTEDYNNGENFRPSVFNSESTWCSGFYITYKRGTYYLNWVQ